MVVLIVEDEVLVGMELQMTLRMAGHQVGEPTSSAVQALRVAAAERPDLAFVDVNLEGGAEGPLPASYATGTTPPASFSPPSRRR